MGRCAIRILLSDETEASTAEDLQVLKKDLSAMGVRLTIPDSLPGGTLVFEYDDEAHTRNAGRKKKAVPANSDLSEMTSEDEPPPIAE